MLIQFTALCTCVAATIKTVAIKRQNKVCALYMIPVTKTEYAPNIKHALINKMRLLSRIYGMTPLYETS